MLFQRIVVKFPPIELDGAKEALHVVVALLGGAVKEAGAGELINLSAQCSCFEDSKYPIRSQLWDFDVATPMYCLLPSSYCSEMMRGACSTDEESRRYDVERQGFAWRDLWSPLLVI